MEWKIMRLRTGVRTRWWLPAVMLLATCDSSGNPAPAGAAPDTVLPRQRADLPPEPAQWTATELRGPARFRAFGWGAGDTLWGISRGRLAMASLAGDTLVRPGNVWNVGTATGQDLVWWTAEDGLHVMRAGNTAPTAAEAPTGEHTGPEVLWSPDGRLALLTWTAEAGPAHTLLDNGAHRPLRAALPGYAIGSEGIWLDSVSILLPATSLRSATGQSSYREGGYRSDLAVIDVARDTAYVVHTSPDGEFLQLEGMLGPGRVLAGVRQRGETWQHFTIDADAGSVEHLSLEPGRAAAAHGVTALLRPLSDPMAGGEPEFELVMIRRDGRTQSVGRFRGMIRLLWHPDQLILAVSQDSEAPGGYRTVIVR